MVSELLKLQDINTIVGNWNGGVENKVPMCAISISYGCQLVSGCLQIQFFAKGLGKAVGDGPNVRILAPNMGDPEELAAVANGGVKQQMEDLSSFSLPLPLFL